MIDLYTREECIFCEKAKALLEKNNIEHTVFLLYRDFVREDINLLFPKARTYPVVVINGEYIGGYVELSEIYS